MKITDTSVTGRTLTAAERPLYEAAQKLEASFLTEMLKSAGYGGARESFGGGVGEDQFGSFLLQEQSMQIVKSGGFGLTDALFEVLKERNNDK